MFVCLFVCLFVCFEVFFVWPFDFMRKEKWNDIFWSQSIFYRVGRVFCSLRWPSALDDWSCYGVQSCILWDVGKISVMSFCCVIMCVSFASLTNKIRFIPESANHNTTTQRAVNRSFLFYLPLKKKRVNRSFLETCTALYTFIIPRIILIYFQTQLWLNNSFKTEIAGLSRTSSSFFNRSIK